MGSAARKTGRCLHLVLGAGDEALDSCRRCCDPGDSILFLDAGVMHLLTSGPGIVGEHVQSICFAGADVDARGLGKMAHDAGVRLLSDQEFPGLLADHDHCLSWK